MGFISTWKRNAVHNLKPFQCPFHHRMVGVSERLSSCGCLDRSCSPFACFKAEKYKKSFWVVFILPHFHNTLSLGRLQCLCMKDWGYGRVTAEPPQSSASPKLLALALSCSNDQALGCSSAPKAKSFYVTFFCSKWQRITLCLFGLASYWDVGSCLVYCSLSHFHMAFYWRPKHFFGRVLDSTFFLN